MFDLSSFKWAQLSAFFDPFSLVNAYALISYINLQVSFFFFFTVKGPRIHIMATLVTSSVDNENRWPQYNHMSTTLGCTNKIQNSAFVALHQLGQIASTLQIFYHWRNIKYKTASTMKCISNVYEPLDEHRAKKRSSTFSKRRMYTFIFHIHFAGHSIYHVKLFWQPNDLWHMQISSIFLATCWAINK